MTEGRILDVTASEAQKAIDFIDAAATSPDRLLWINKKRYEVVSVDIVQGIGLGGRPHIAHTPDGIAVAREGNTYIAVLVGRPNA